MIEKDELLMKQTIKDKAMSFLELVASGKIREAYEKYASPDFRHHNLYFKGDAESLISAMEESASKNPDKVFVIKHAVAENDMVAVHSHVRQHPNDPGAAVVHLFRFSNELIIELWDVGQQIPENSPNENGPF